MPLTLTPHVHIGFPVNPDERLFILGVSQLGAGDVLAAAGSGYVEVTDRLDGNKLEPIHIARGRSSPLGDYETSKCTLNFRNDDGRFDPLNLNGPYVAAGETLVRCGRRVLVTMERSDGTVEARFAGQIESYAPDVSIRGWPTMTIECEGPMALMARINPDASTPTGEGEDSGARQARLADIAEVADGDRDFQTGDNTLQATTAAQNILTEMRLTAASESPLGGFYEKRTGQLAHDNRRAPLDETRQREVQATFAPPGVADTLPYTDLRPAFDKQRLRNDVHAARVGGESVIVQDDASIALHGLYTDRRTDLIVDDDNQVAYWVQWRALLFGDAEYRYDSVSLDALACTDAQLDDMAEAMIARELRDRIAVMEQIEYRSSSDVLSTRSNTVEVFVEHIDEWIGWQSYRMDLDLSSAEKLSDPFVLGVSVLGGTDRLMPL